MRGILFFSDPKVSLWSELGTEWVEILTFPCPPTLLGLWYCGSLFSGLTRVHILRPIKLVFNNNFKFSELTLASLKKKVLKIFKQFLQKYTLVFVFVSWLGVLTMVEKSFFHFLNILNMDTVLWISIYYGYLVWS